MANAVAVRNHGLSSARYEIEATDQYGNTVKLKGILYAEEVKVPDYPPEVK
jgi:hypothetical protein